MMRVSGMTAARLVDGFTHGLDMAAMTLQGMVKCPVVFTDPALEVRRTPEAVDESGVATCRADVPGLSCGAMQLAFVGLNAGQLLDALRDAGGSDDAGLAKEILEEIGLLLMDRCGESLSASLATVMTSLFPDQSGDELVFESQFSIPAREVSGQLSLTVRSSQGPH